MQHQIADKLSKFSGVKLLLFHKCVFVYFLLRILHFEWIGSPRRCRGAAARQVLKIQETQSCLLSVRLFMPKRRRSVFRPPPQPALSTPSSRFFPILASTHTVRLAYSLQIVLRICRANASMPASIPGMRCAVARSLAVCSMQKFAGSIAVLLRHMVPRSCLATRSPPE